jgi:hypothetical protein
MRGTLYVGAGWHVVWCGQRMHADCLIVCGATGQCESWAGRRCCINKLSLLVRAAGSNGGLGLDHRRVAVASAWTSCCYVSFTDVAWIGAFVRSTWNSQRWGAYRWIDRTTPRPTGNGLVLLCHVAAATYVGCLWSRKKLPEQLIKFTYLNRLFMHGRSSSFCSLTWHACQQ